MSQNVLLQDHSAYPRTIVFSTHLIEECKNLMDEVIILDSGRILTREDMGSINEKSFYVAGRKDRVENHLKGKNVLYMEEIGRIARTAIFDSVTAQEQRGMEQDGIEIQPMPLQKLFIYLTSKNGGKENEQDAAAV